MNLDVVGLGVRTVVATAPANPPTPAGPATGPAQDGKAVEWSLLPTQLGALSTCHK